MINMTTINELLENPEGKVRYTPEQVQLGWDAQESLRRTYLTNRVPYKCAVQCAQAIPGPELAGIQHLLLPRGQKINPNLDELKRAYYYLIGTGTHDPNYDKTVAAILLQDPYFRAAHANLTYVMHNSDVDVKQVAVKVSEIYKEKSKGFEMEPEKLIMAAYATLAAIKDFLRQRRDSEITLK